MILSGCVVQHLLQHKIAIHRLFPILRNGPINGTAILILQDGVKLHDITVYRSL